MTLPPFPPLGTPEPLLPAGADPERWRRGVQDRLFEQRAVFLWGYLDDARAGDVAAQLMTLDAGGDDPVHLHIDCPGGTLEAAFTLVDVIDLLGVDLVATCVGQAVGPALGPLAVAHHRRATTHARLRLAEPVLQRSGRAGELATWAEHQRAQLGRFCERLGAAVGRDTDVVAADLASGRFLDAHDAVAYGLVDEICGPGARVYPMPGRPLGFTSVP